jgi:hypothetical protein
LISLGSELGGVEAQWLVGTYPYLSGEITEGPLAVPSFGTITFTNIAAFTSNTVTGAAVAELDLSNATLVDLDIFGLLNTTTQLNLTSLQVTQSTCVIL